MFSFEVDEVRYNTVVVYSRQCFSGCALHKLFVVRRCAMSRAGVGVKGL